MIFLHVVESADIIIVLLMRDTSSHAYVYLSTALVDTFHKRDFLIIHSAFWDSLAKFQVSLVHHILSLWKLG